MCMALAGGNQPEPPQSRLQRLRQWLGFGALLGRFLTVGLWQWLTQRWIARNPNIS